jgi:integrase
MPRATRDARLDTAAARARLSARKKPYYRLIEAGLHIGYYRGVNGGSWIARRYRGEGSYETGRLGLADDGRHADGAEVLTFTQAQSAARAWATHKAKQAAGTDDPKFATVAEAVAAYLADYSARGGKARSYVETTFNAHILPKLGGLKMVDLTAMLLRSWHRALATAPARLRSAPTAQKQNVRPIDQNDSDAHRARRATANAVLTLLKAALNLAFREGHVPTDAAWRKVRSFQKVSAARVRYLTDDEATRLVNACPPDFRVLVTAAVLTGCRYQELAALRPSDIDLAAGVISMRASKGGSARHVVLTQEARSLFQQLTAGRRAPDLILRRADGGAWGKSHQFRPLRVACAAAQITPPISFHILRHTHASRLAMRGVPMAVIAAQLGHSDVKLTARHYAHLSPGYVADTIRAAFGEIGLVAESNIEPIRRDRA